VFGIVRKKSRSQLVKQELGQSVEHFKLAATHAARGTGASVGPKINAARDRVQPAAGRVRDAATTSWGSTLAALAPLAAAATEGARQANKDTRKAKAKNMKALQKKTDKALGRKRTGRRVSRLTGLLIAGAAVGAAGAIVLRRKQQAKWDEYDPSRPINAGDQANAESSLTAADAAFEPVNRSGLGNPQSSYGDQGQQSGASYPQTFSDRNPSLSGERSDQTTSALHSPTVARMAGGGSNQG
jgi:hypothetical protein